MKPVFKCNLLIGSGTHYIIFLVSVSFNTGPPAFKKLMDS
jgi:hypothetical protein